MCLCAKIVCRFGLRTIFVKNFSFCPSLLLQFGMTAESHYCFNISESTSTELIHCHGTPTYQARLFPSNNGSGVVKTSNLRTLFIFQFNKIVYTTHVPCITHIVYKTALSHGFIHASSPTAISPALPISTAYYQSLQPLYSLAAESLS